MNSAHPARFVDAGVGEMEQTATISADEGALSANLLVALAA